MPAPTILMYHNVCEVPATAVIKGMHVTPEQFRWQIGYLQRKGCEFTTFLGIEPFDGSVLEKTWRVHGVRSQIRNMNAEAIARLSEEDIECVRRTAGPELEKFGHGAG